MHPFMLSWIMSNLSSNPEVMHIIIENITNLVVNSAASDVLNLWNSGGSVPTANSLYPPNFTYPLEMWQNWSESRSFTYNGTTRISAPVYTEWSNGTSPKSALNWY